MSVYVDDLMACIPSANWRWNESCHLVADNLDELHAFAAEIGLRRAWFQQSRKGLPHYDLTPNRRIAAVRAGAIELDRHAFVELVRSQLGRTETVRTNT